MSAQDLYYHDIAIQVHETSVHYQDDEGSNTGSLVVVLS
jgi:hypothetical protein